MCLRASVLIGTTRTHCGNRKAVLQHLVQLQHYVKTLSNAFHATYLGSAVGVATDYGLDGLGVESRWGGGRDFPHPSRPALGPTQPPIQWVRGSFPGVKRPGRGLDHPPHLTPRLEVE